MIRRPPRSTLFPPRRFPDLPPRVQPLRRPRRHRARRRFVGGGGGGGAGRGRRAAPAGHPPARGEVRLRGRRTADRKSTRLNPSHLVISYAVFCLKKKKKY